MVEVDPVKQIRNFNELKQINAYKKWHKNISEELAVELDEKERELFCLSMNAETPLEHSFWTQVWHYEQFLTAKNKKKTYARYTRRAVEELDVKRFLENLVRKPETLGFKHLEEFDSLDISYEQVILEHADQFDADIIKAVNKRLSKQD
jgi:hypothetical protein|tara:strand:+ start:170 stop:616 length:447 start_codon:yes stop_codon:yes gene_type:complete